MLPLNFASAAQIVGPDLNHNTQCGHFNWIWIHFHQNVHQGLNLLVLPALNHLIAIHSRSAIRGAAAQLRTSSSVTSIEAIQSKAEEHLVSLMSMPPEQQREVLRPVIDEIAAKIEAGGTSLYPIIASLYRSVLLQTYIAFESMSEELWEKALNVHPHDLSQVVFSEREKKGIMPEKLQEMGFDLRNRMGTLLKSKFRFEVLKEIRLAYTGAFSTNGGEVFDAITDQRLDVICLLRNLIVHSGGKIDTKFLDQSKSVAKLARIRALGEGAEIPLDGKLLKEVVEGGIDVGIRLINAVDRWIIQNPSPRRSA